ncbi:related to Multisubstrate pseudouridine synthase 7 [Hanseniaspora guilliermondii]|uniref:Related to Multisubstrate pseudouridine synthase 7 n=1 Tax=Hanseniaspora guilliermondii TaxID=56406 RepID=A0A1L0D0N9_9ASCO|nr:related to Multisubstrate pseudouridine synthase 7 [Hanseniaspora guilliermondii]
MTEVVGEKRTQNIDTEDNLNKKTKINTQNDDSLREADVGITEYLYKDIQGFNGTIKQRYSDFIVNEINTDGEVVVLKDKGFQQKEKKKSSEGTENSQKTDKRASLKEERSTFVLDPEVKEQLAKIIGEEDVENIVNKVYKNFEIYETTQTFDSKDERTKIHQLLRKGFNNELESRTNNDNSFKILNGTGKNQRIGKQQLIESQKDEHGVENFGYGPSKQFIHFTLYKENKETMDACNVIGRLLKVPTKTLGICGTKDKRGITTQRVSLNTRMGLSRVNALNKTLKGMCIGGYEFKDNALKLGDLNGNKFTIALRNVELNDDEKGINTTKEEILNQILSNSIEKLTKTGFLNYFGMQRFGSFSIPTYEIGKKILKGDYKGACELLLSNQKNVDSKTIEARIVWEQSKDAQKTLKLMPKRNVAEFTILSHLATKERNESTGEYTPDDYFTAILKIPRNLRLIYIHAYQSYIWNLATSYRVAQHGLNVVPGDLVIESNKEVAVVDEDNFEIEDVAKDNFIRAKPLTEEDVNSGRYTVFDIVLPTPGFDVHYPEFMKDFYEEVMKKDDLSPFEMIRKVKEFSLPGSYRNILGKPKNMNFKIINYMNDNDDILNSDLEILNSNNAKNNGRNCLENKLGKYAISDEKSSVYASAEDHKVAVILEFELGTSSYATMLLRELLKVETSRNGDLISVKQ